jgi:hypothetical protein
MSTTGGGRASGHTQHDPPMNRRDPLLLSWVAWTVWPGGGAAREILRNPWSRRNPDGHRAAPRMHSAWKVPQSHKGFKLENYAGFLTLRTDLHQILMGGPVCPPPHDNLGGDWACFGWYACGGEVGPP